MSNKQTYFGDSNKIAEIATKNCMAYIQSLGFEVHDVQGKDKRYDVYRRLDVDLVVVDPKSHDVIWVELKGDNQEQYGNFFMEYVSNDKLMTPGCMLITKSKYVFYYFVNTKILYIMDTREMQAWLRDELENRSRRFRDGVTGTCNKKGDREWYNTIGKRVPITILMEEIDIDVRQL